MSRTRIVLAVALALGWACQQQGETGTDEAPADTAATSSVEPELGVDLSTPEGRIANAESAGPEEIVKNATILDWPVSRASEMVTLRAGTNGWTCLPDSPNTPGDHPMCLDRQWMKVMAALKSKTEPEVDGVGISYMFQGGFARSRHDPFATEPKAGEDWADDDPFLMVITSDPSHFATLPTDPATGGPWVMWSGTSYAHLMVPLGKTLE